MSLSFQLQFAEAPFPTGFEGDLNAYAQQLVANLSATITGNFLTGQVGGTQPTTNIGPWANGTQWWFWNATLNTYQPEFATIQPDYNAIINGLTNCWQRATTTSSIGATATYPGADRWKFTGSMTTGVATVSRQTAGITGGQFQNTINPDIEYCNRITVTTPQASLNAGDHFEITQYVEQQIGRPCFDVATSLSLALRASITGTFCVSIVDEALGESWVGECVVATANTWVFYTFQNIPAFPNTAVLGASDNAAAYLVRICAAAGSTFNAGTANAWSSGNFVGDNNQSNLFATNGSTLDFTLVKHQPGTIVTPFKVTPFDQEVSRCQRYYYKSYDYGTGIAAATNIGEWTATCVTSSIAFPMQRFPVPQRADSSPTSSNSGIISAGTAPAGNAVFNQGTTANVSLTSLTLNSTWGFSTLGSSAGFTANNVIRFHVVSDVDF